MKARNETELAIGWHAARFTRDQKLKPLSDYLRPAPPPEARRDKGARDVKRMFDRMIAKQAAQRPADPQ